MAKYIDAEALINELQSHGAICDFGVFLMGEQPAADVQEVKHGQWEEERLVSGEIKYTCSKCGQVFQGESLDFNYCPNCGAKMDGKESDDGN